MTLADEDTNSVIKPDAKRAMGIKCKFNSRGPLCFCLDVIHEKLTKKNMQFECLQIGVTTALNLPGTAKEEFFFPVEPKGAKGQEQKLSFGYLNDNDIWGLST